LQKKNNDIVIDDEADNDDDGTDRNDADIGNTSGVKAVKAEVQEGKAGTYHSQDGYGYGIPIAKWAFVCRFEKNGLSIYDRRQTDNYFGATLDCFQEYSTLPLDDLDVHEANTPCYNQAEDPRHDIDQLRMCTLKQTLNMRRQIEAIGHGVTGMIKGHVTIRPCNQGADRAAPDPEIGSVEEVTTKWESSGGQSAAQSPPDPRHAAARPSGLHIPKLPLAALAEAPSTTSPRALPAAEAAPTASAIKPQTPNLAGPPSQTHQQPATLQQQARMKHRMRRGDGSTQSIPVTCPISNMWVERRVRVVVRIFSVCDMCPAEDEISPYITLHLSRPGGADVERRCDDVGPIAPGGSSLDVYWQTDVLTSLPGSCVLAIKLWQKAPAISRILGAKDTELGSLSLDLEDRHFALEQRDFRTVASERRLRRLVSPSSSISVVRPSPEQLVRCENRLAKTFKSESQATPPAGLHMGIHPRRAPNPPAPIEYRDLTLMHGDGCPEDRIGTLRFCTEIMDATEEYRPSNMLRATSKLHIRIYIEEVDNIRVFFGTGLKNNVKIKGEFQLRSWTGDSMPTQCRETDTHKWAQTHASFDFVWHFLIDYPIGAASLKLSMVDVHLLRGDCDIYRPEILPMDALLRAFSDAGLDTAACSEDLVFDSWPDDYPEWRKYINGMGCLHLACYKVGKLLFSRIPRFCRRNARVPRPKPAKMSLRITLNKVASDFALQNEVEEPPEEPTGRVNWSTGLSSPSTLVKSVVGRANVESCVYVVSCLCCIICFLVMLIVLFFLFELVRLAS
jgi:hypothetical protein